MASCFIDNTLRNKCSSLVYKNFRSMIKVLSSFQKK
uniref:Uncharacterized protein n=1 Tax=Rhizophora mucronata TaxID=61149 RepID=A0A2P2Q2B3_RHIMU